MKKLHIFFHNSKRRGLLLGILGIFTIFTLTYNPTINESNNDILIATELFLLIPLIMVMLIVGFVPYLSQGADKLNYSIKKALATPLNVYNWNFLTFHLWGGVLGFAISTFIAVNSLNLILDTTFVIPPELSKDIIKLFLYTLQNPGPSFVISLMIIPLLGYAIFFIYKMVYFGTIMKLEKYDKYTSNTKDVQKVGKFSIFILLLSVFGVITYLYTMFPSNFEKLEDWNKIIMMFLPIYSIGMSSCMLIGIFVVRILYFIVGYKMDS